MTNEFNNLREFGGCRLDVEKRFLWCGDNPVDLPPKTLDLLCLFVEKRGEVVSKEEIWKTVWPDAFVEETNLTHNVYLLRKALRQLGETDLIQTVPRRGYRFTGDLRSNVDLVIERHSVSQTIEEISQPSETKVRSFITNWFAGTALVSILLIVAVGFAAWRGYSGASLADGQIRSIAVMPFNGIGDDSEVAGLGIADLIITRLSNIKEINVRPTSAVIKLNGVESVAAGERLNVDAVLEGSVFRTDDKIRITARLLRVSGGEPVWAGEFEKPLNEELNLHQEIAGELIDALALNLEGTGSGDLTKRFTDSAGAHQLYVKGRYNWNKRSTEGMGEAVQLFRSAIEQDPNFALAHVGLADTLMMSELVPVVSLKAVNRAIELDPDLAEAHATLGFIRMFHEWNWDEAENAFKTSIRLNPNYATAHHWYAQLLAIEGRNDEAKVAMRRALDIDPLSQNFLADLGQIHYFAGEFKQAEEYCLRALSIDPTFVLGHKYLHNIYLQTGDYEKAAEAQRRYLFYEDPPGKGYDLDAAIAAAQDSIRQKGPKGYLQAFLKNPLHPNHSYGNAAIHAITDENEAALSEIEKAYEGRAFLAAYVKADPSFRHLHGNPRFESVLMKMGLNQ